MRKPKKFARNEIVGQRFSVDSDELQLLDECNSEWVDAWKTATKQKTELEVQVVTQAKQETKLAGARAKKRR